MSAAAQKSVRYLIKFLKNVIDAESSIKITGASRTLFVTANTFS